MNENKKVTRVNIKIGLLTQLMRQEAGIHRSVETINTAPTRLSFNIDKTRLILSSSTISQNRSTISWTVFSQIPYRNKVDLNYCTRSFQPAFNCTYAITKSVNAWCTIRQDIVGLKGKASVVEVVTAAALACICNSVAHARLIILRFAEWQTSSITTLAFFQAFSAIRLRCRSRALRTST